MKAGFGLAILWGPEKSSGVSSENAAMYPFICKLQRDMYLEKDQAYVIYGTPYSMVDVSLRGSVSLTFWVR